MMKRVAIVSVGAVTPIGNSFDEAWESALSGRSGVSMYQPMPEYHCGRLSDFNALEYVAPKDVTRYDPFVIFAYSAALQAISSVELPPETGVVMGSSRGGIGSIEAAVSGRASAYLMAGSTISMAASFIAERTGARGHVLGISNACSSGSNAIGEGFRLIREGRLKAAIAGGAEAPLCSVCLRGYGASGALTKAGVVRPFDKRRDGFALAEGAAVIVMMEMEHALDKGYEVIAEVMGYGNTADAYHPTLSSPKGQVSAINAALADARISASDVGIISAHATSTPKGDAAEAAALGQVMSGKAPVFAAKSLTGHMLAASGAFEVALAARALRDGVVPPTINADEPEFGMNISSGAREHSAHVAIASSFGFGGVNSTLVIARHG